MAEDGKIVYKVTIDDTGVDTDAAESGKSAGAAWGGAFDENAGEAIVTAAGNIGTALTSAANEAWKVANTLVSQAAEKGDAISKGAQAIGWSTDAYQNWAYVLDKSGTSINSARNSILALEKASETMTDSQKDAFAQLGLSVEQVQAMKPEDLFASVIAGLQGVEDIGTRNSLAQALLGGGYKNLSLLLGTTAEETQEMMEHFKGLNDFMSEDAIANAVAYKDSIEDLGSAVDGLKTTLGEVLLPMMTSLREGLVGLLTDHGEELVGWIEAIGGALLAWKGITVVASLVSDLSKMYGMLTSLAGFLGISTAAAGAGLAGVGLAAYGVYQNVNWANELDAAGYLGEGHSLSEYEQNAADAQAALEEWHKKNDEYMNSGNTEGLDDLQNQLALLELAAQHSAAEFEAAKEAVEAMGESTETAAPQVKGFADGTEEAAAAAGQALEEISDHSEGLRDDFQEGMGGLDSVAAEEVEAVNDTMTTNMEILNNNADIWGYDFMVALANGMIRGFNEAVLPTVQSVTETMAAYLHHSEPDKGPLSDDNDWMPDMMRTFAQGILDNKHLISDALGDSFNLHAQIGASMGDMERAASGRISAGRVAPLEIIVPLSLNGTEIARATAWAMGEQLSWEMM